jgi:hypothetical protein
MPTRLIDPVLHDLWNYWCARRGGRSCPAFDEIDLGALGPVVDRVLMVRRDGGEFRYSFVGSSIRAIYGYPMEGLLLSAALPAERRDAAIHRYALVCDSGRPLFARNGYQVDKAIRFRVDRLILPLAGAGGTIVGAICGQIMRSATDGIPAESDNVVPLANDTLLFLDGLQERAAS